MGGQEAPITPKDSVTAMLTTMDQLSDQDQGAFMHQDKQPLAWWRQRSDKNLTVIASFYFWVFSCIFDFLGVFYNL